ncbi:zinc-binding dehydrogenase [Nonomuraea dietziae]|uniref:zinc-binding dehydrogenase n=1 Tax=Nonomuraea dietziae TaxID=65515 RepID=UPI0031E42032
MHVITIEEPGLVRVRAEEPGDLASGTVRVRTLYSGVSAGTELTAYRGTNPYLNRKWDTERRLFVEGQSHTYPLSGWGYQEVGEVVEAAPDVSDPPVGSLVWGIWGHRDEAIVPAEKLVGHMIPPGVDPLAGVFARVGAIALNAVHAADIHLGDQVAIFGQGVIGLLATRLAVLNGARVVAADALPARLELAKRFGAAEAFDVGAGSVAEFVRKRIEGADTAIELSGSHQGLHEAIRTVRKGGRVVAGPASTRARASGCGWERSSTTTRCSSSPRRSAASPRGCPTGGTSSGCSARSWSSSTGARSTPSA